MSKALLVIINGPPGAGKTTLGRRLARDLKLPFLSKDDLKECLFDSLGWSDRAWSQKLGRASVEPLQICCTCGDEVLFERFRKRIDSGERHPGHADQLTTLTEFKALMIRERFLEIGGSFIRVDTTDLDDVDYSALEAQVTSTMRRLGGT